MNEIKLQIGCLVIMLYIIIMYVRDSSNGKIKCNKCYDALLYIAPWSIVLDGVTSWTVNHLDIVPRGINVVAHTAFYMTMVLDLILSAIYMYNQIAGFRERDITKKLLPISGVIALTLILIGSPSIEFREGDVTNYSQGFSVYVCFASLAIYFGFIIFNLIWLHKNIQSEKKFGTMAFIFFIGLMMVCQLIFPEFLMSSTCPTIMIMGIYIVFENPALKKLEMQNEHVIDAFATLVESRDNNTGGHIKRTRLYVKLLLKKMQGDKHYNDVMSQDYVEYVSEAAPLHDVGKIAIPDEILQKPGRFTDEEYEIMKTHSAVGGDIILNTFSNMFSEEAKKITYEVARFHHEKYNGKGYPDGLVGEQIPLHARIMAIADVFDAVSQNRCYRGAMPLDECFSIIEKGKGTDFDPLLVELFLEAKDEVTELFEKNKDV